MLLNEVQAEIAKMRADKKSYQFIGDKYGVNKGIIWRIYKSDYEPKNKEIRKKLGLENIMVDFVRQVRNEKGRFAKGESG